MSSYCIHRFLGSLDEIANINLANPASSADISVKPDNFEYTDPADAKVADSGKYALSGGVGSLDDSSGFGDDLLERLRRRVEAEQRQDSELLTDRDIGYFTNDDDEGEVN